MFKNPSFLFDIVCTVVWLLLAVRYARKAFSHPVSSWAGMSSASWAPGLFGLGCCRGVPALSGRELPYPDRREHLGRRGRGPDRHRGQVRGLSAESFRASIVETCERSISLCSSDNAVVLADAIVQKVLAPLLTPVISVVLFFVAFACCGCW